MEGAIGREPPVSARIKRLPRYLFARLNAMTAEARARGVDVIDLGMGNPDRPPHPFVIEKL
jgi:alanine-synthesizing transaminase